LGLEGVEAIGDGEQLFAHRSQMIEAFLQAEVGKVVGACLIAQEAGCLRELPVPRRVVPHQPVPQGHRK
jgi:hypothetical protein